MKLSYLTGMIYEVNAALDSGKFDAVDMAEVEGQIEAKTLIPWIAQTFKGHADMSLHMSDAASEAAYHDEMADILGGYQGKERRKWGVEHRGLCLLIAWTTEIIARKKFTA